MHKLSSKVFLGLGLGLSITANCSHAAILSVDIGDISGSDVQAGFDEFLIGGEIAAGTSVSQTFGGITLDVAAVGEKAQDRLRPGPSDGGALTTSALYRDFVFSYSKDVGSGLDVTVSGLDANTQYNVTLWSFDILSNAMDGRFSDWTANGAIAQEDYMFSGSGGSVPTTPTADGDNSFTMQITSDASGAILLEGRWDTKSDSVAGNPDFGVFLNGIQVTEIPEPVSLNLLGLGCIVLLKRHIK